jgi:tight adherence protein B
MSAALLSAALAVLLWPGPASVRRWRMSAVMGGATGDPSSRWSRPSLPVLAAVGGAAVVAVASTPLVAVLATASAFAGTRAWTTARARAADERRLRSLADGLGALAADLRGGRALETAARTAGTACGDDEVGRALGRAVRAPDTDPPARGSTPVADALARVSAAVVLSRRTGCSLAAVVSAVEDDVRARHRHRLELRSATAGPRASAALLAGLPVLGLAMGSGVGADPWRVLTTTATGQVLLVVGATLEVAGLAWSRRLIDRAARA